MLCHLLDYLVRDGRNIGTCKCAVCYMDRVTDGCCNNLCVISVNIKDLCDLADQFDTRLADVIQSAKEWGNICSSCVCCKDCLVCAEDQGNVCLDALRRKYLYGFESFYGHRDLYNHVWMDGCDLTSFFDHALCIYCCCLYLAADRSVNDGCNFFDDFCKISSLFCDQGWVCGNSTDDSHIICFLNVLYICCIHEKLHNKIPPFYLRLLLSVSLNIAHVKSKRKHKTKENKSYQK